MCCHIQMHLTSCQLVQFLNRGIKCLFLNPSQILAIFESKSVAFAARKPSYFTSLFFFGKLENSCMKFKWFLKITFILHHHHCHTSEVQFLARVICNSYQRQKFYFHTRIFISLRSILVNYLSLVKIAFE